MNKEELITAVAEKAQLSKGEATKAVNAVVKSIAEALSAGQQVALVGFGSFAVKERPAREGRNPQTGKAISIAASKIPGFKPGKALRDAVN